MPPVGRDRAQKNHARASNKPNVSELGTVLDEVQGVFESLPEKKETEYFLRRYTAMIMSTRGQSPIRKDSLAAPKLASAAAQKLTAAEAKKLAVSLERYGFKTHGQLIREPSAVAQKLAVMGEKHGFSKRGHLVGGKSAKQLRLVAIPATGNSYPSWVGAMSVPQIEGELSELALVGSIQQGLSLFALSEIERIFSREQVFKIIPESTIRQRKSKGNRLTPKESDHAARIMRLWFTAIRSFGDETLAREWLISPHPMLEERKPISIAETEAGGRLVERLLGAIAWGAAA